MAHRALEGISADILVQCLEALGWSHQREVWAPDVQTDTFVRGDDNVTVTQETYCPLNISGEEPFVAELDAACQRRATLLEKSKPR